MGMSGQRQSCITTDDQSVSLGVEPHLGLMTRYFLLFHSYGLTFVGHPLWREDGSVFCICCFSRVRVPWDSRPYFTVSDLRLPISSPLTTRTDRVANTFTNSSSIVACELVAVGTCLFVKALLSNGCVYLLIENLLRSSGCCLEVVIQ
jgi:hypothetical protein